jgi:hypothetical protein
MHTESSQPRTSCGHKSNSLEEKAEVAWKCVVVTGYLAVMCMAQTDR